jgi:thioredoxin 1
MIPAGPGSCRRSPAILGNFGSGKIVTAKRIAAAVAFILTGAVSAACPSSADSSGTPQKQPAGKKVTFVELGSRKCVQCQMMQIVMKEIKREYGEDVNVVFYDVRTKTGRLIAEKYKIRMIPTQVFLDGESREFLRHEGYFPKDDIIRVLKTKGVQ